MLKNNYLNEYKITKHEIKITSLNDKNYHNQSTFVLPYNFEYIFCSDPILLFETSNNHNHNHNHIDEIPLHKTIKFVIIFREYVNLSVLITCYKLYRYSDPSSDFKIEDIPVILQELTFPNLLTYNANESIKKIITFGDNCVNHEIDLSNFSTIRFLYFYFKDNDNTMEISD